MASISSSSTDNNNTEFPASSDKYGEVVFSGGASWSMTGRTSATKEFDGVPADQILLSFHRLKPMMNIPISRVICGSNANHSILLDSNGFAYTWGRNEFGQLGLGDTTNRYNPVKLNPGADGAMERFRAGGVGLGHSMLVTVQGQIYSTGLNTMYQLGTGRKDQKYEWNRKSKENIYTIYKSHTKKNRYRRRNGEHHKGIHRKRNEKERTKRERKQHNTKGGNSGIQQKNTRYRRQWI